MTKRVVTSLLFTLAASVATVVAQSGAVPKAQDAPKSMDITVTGCLIQGSGPTVFLLDNARVNPQDTNEKGARYLVINKMEDVSLTANLDHELTIGGTLGIKPDPSSGGNADENKLPTLTTKSVVVTADRCTAGR